MPSIYNYSQSELRSFLSLLGDKPFRAEQIFRWVYHQRVQDFADMVNIPKSLRNTLSEQLSFSLPSIQQEQISQCGTTKWLMTLGDDNAFETVYIPETNRGTLCISSQIGCALACQFCATGLAGFYRNLSTADIIGQVYLAQKILQERLERDRPITNIVFMGMGEPLLNEKNVFEAVDILLDDLAFGLSKYRVTISTSGITPAMIRLTEQTNASLAVSLHACNEDLRSRLVPINKKYSLQDLMQACDHYCAKTKRPITYEYVMIDGLNDSKKHALEMVSLLKNRAAKVNLIPYNPVDALTLASAQYEAIHAFCQVLLDHNIRCTVRKTRGDDIDAACGQLFGSVQARKKSIAPYEFLRPQSTKTAN